MFKVFRNKETKETKRLEDESKIAFYKKKEDWELVFKAKDTQFKKVTQK